MLAPASKAALLKNLSGAHLRWRWSTLTYILFGQKMFRFFCPKGNTIANRQSGRRGTVRFDFACGVLQSCPLRCSADIKCATGEVHRRGRLSARERRTQRLSYADFFGYFLVRRQESNITVRTGFINDSIYSDNDSHQTKKEPAISRLLILMYGN